MSQILSNGPKLPGGERFGNQSVYGNYRTSGENIPKTPVFSQDPPDRRHVSGKGSRDESRQRGVHESSTGGGGRRNEGNLPAARGQEDPGKIRHVQIPVDSDLYPYIQSAQQTRVFLQSPSQAVWRTESGTSPVLEPQAEPFNLFPGHMTVVKSKDLYSIQFGIEANPNKILLVNFFRDTGKPFLQSMSDQGTNDNILRLPTDDPQFFAVKSEAQALEPILVVCGKQLEGAKRYLPQISYVFIENLASRQDVFLKFIQEIKK